MAMMGMVVMMMMTMVMMQGMARVQTPFVGERIPLSLVPANLRSLTITALLQCKQRNSMQCRQNNSIQRGQCISLQRMQHNSIQLIAMQTLPTEVAQPMQCM